MIRDNTNIKIIASLILLSFCVIRTVRAIGISPASLDIIVENETEMTRDVRVTNPSVNPIHVTVSVTGSVSQFVTLGPEEFDLQAGPGMGNPGPRPSKYVTVKFSIPKEISGMTYTGEIVFTQQPVGGGTLGAAAQLGVPVKLTTGRIEKKEEKAEEALEKSEEEIEKPEFPLYMNVLMMILTFTLILTLILVIYRKGKMSKNKDYLQQETVLLAFESRSAHRVKV